MHDKSVLPFIVLAWAGLLLSPAVSHSETLVNASFDPPTISSQSYDPTPVTDGPAGTFTFIATFCNKATSQSLGNRLESRTAVLTGGNELLNRTSGSGATSVLAFPPTGGYGDLDLAPGECVQVTYEIGLQQRAPFEFFVDIWLDPPTQLFSNGAQASAWTIVQAVDDFILGDRGNRGDPLVPYPDPIKGVKWKGVNPIFNTDPGNEFRIRIYESNRCVPLPRSNGTRPNTGWDAPFYEAVVTASRVGTGVSTGTGGEVYEYTASIPEFTPTAGCRYFLGIENTFRDSIIGDAWAWVWDTCINCFPTQYAYHWTGRWKLVSDRYVFELTD